MSKLVPSLRFPEFKDSGEWVEKKLGEVCQIKTGKLDANAMQESGQYRFYTCAKEYYQINEYAFDTEALIVSGNGANVGYIHYFKGKFNAYQRTYVLDNFSDNIVFIKYFLDEYLHVRIFTEKKEGNTPYIVMSTLSEMPLLLPTLTEQTKIATFLSSIDERIEALTEQLELTRDYKKGMMQRIFSQELRFKDDEGNEYPEWVEKKLGEVLDYSQPTPYLVASTEYDDSYDVPVLTAGKTFILGYTNEEKGIFSKDLPVIIFDDFTTDSKFVNFPFKAKSSAMKILVGKSDISVKFVFEAMQQIKYEVGGHGRHWISVFSQMMMFFPCLEEQTKIATFLSSIDNRIEALSEQLEKTKLFKKAMLQRVLV